MISASMSLDASFFDEIDTVSVVDDGQTYTTRFKVAYDYYDELVRLSATVDTPEGEIVLDEICGAVFFDGDGKADAVFDIDGERITLGELTEICAIDQVGLFSKAVAAAKAAAQAVAAAATQAARAVVAAVQTVAAAATAVVKSIAEQMTDLVDGAIARITGGMLSVYSIAEAFSVAKLKDENKEISIYVPEYTNGLAKLVEVLEYIKNLPQATAEMKKALSDDSLPMLYRIIVAVTKCGLLELTADRISNAPFSVGLVIAAANYANNKELDENAVLDKETGLIEYQKLCTAWKAGLNNLEWSGCNYIAVYNYMKVAGKYMKLADVVFEFDVNSTQNLFSTFGINPYEVPVFFMAHGIPYVRYDSVDALQAAANAKGNCRIMLSYVWIYKFDSIPTLIDGIIYSNPSLGAHNALIEKRESLHTIHNDGYSRTCENIAELLKLNYDDSGYYEVFTVGYILP